MQIFLNLKIISNLKHNEKLCGVKKFTFRAGDVVPWVKKLQGGLASTAKLGLKDKKQKEGRVLGWLRG